MAPRLTCTEEDGWELESGEARHAAAPTTFWIPSAEARESVQVGRGVKLIFRIETEDEAGELEVAIERMWVYVTGRAGRFYTGRLQSQPDCTPDMQPGFPVAFGPEHIIDIDDPPAGYEPS